MKKIVNIMFDHSMITFFNIIKTYKKLKFINIVSAVPSAHNHLAQRERRTLDLKKIRRAQFAGKINTVVFNYGLI